MRSSLYYIEPKDNSSKFGVKHYAGPVSFLLKEEEKRMSEQILNTCHCVQVIYDTHGFLEKNRDTLKPDVFGLMKDSGKK